MRGIILSIFCLISIMTAQAQDIDKMALRLSIEKQFSDYPESMLQDVYKAFYQDYFGPEHMITDTVAVANYLSQELETMGTHPMPLYYEPIGLNGDYVRVYLNAVADGKITADELLRAFIDSASVNDSRCYDWESLWKAIVDVLDDVKPGLGTSEEHEALLQASHENRAVHHSSVYRNAYHPHYRIVEHNIFEMLLKNEIDR